MVTASRNDLESPEAVDAAGIRPLGELSGRFGVDDLGAVEVRRSEPLGAGYLDVLVYPAGSRDTEHGPPPAWPPPSRTCGSAGQSRISL